MFEEYSLNQVLDIRNHNNVVLVIGESGTGKSSFINHLVGREVAKVSHVERGTHIVSGYQFAENIIVCDTRGTNEINDKDEKSWEDLYQTICLLSPDLLLLCIDGSKRDNIDSLFTKIESYLDKLFKEHRIDPQLGIIANKMDLLEPIGSNNMPTIWPDIRSEKGKNIQEKFKQIEIVSHKIKSNLVILEPTYLEWYGEGKTKPWNLDNIKELLKEKYSVSPIQKLNNFVINPNDYESLIATKVHLTKTDMIATYDDKKGHWLNAFISSSKYSHKDVVSLKQFWQEIYRENTITKKIIKDEILSFIPYYNNQPSLINEKVDNLDANFYKKLVNNFFKVLFNIDINESENWNREFNACYQKIENAFLFGGDWYNLLLPSEGANETNYQSFHDKIILPMFYPVFYAFIFDNIKTFFNKYSVNDNYLIATKILSLFNYLLENNNNEDLVLFMENRVFHFECLLEKKNVFSKYLSAINPFYIIAENLILDKQYHFKLRNIVDIYKKLMENMTKLRKEKNILFYREKQQ